MWFWEDFLQWTGGHFVTPASGKHKTQVWKIQHRQVNVHVISCDFRLKKSDTMWYHVHVISCDFLLKKSDIMWYHVHVISRNKHVISNQLWSSFAVDVFFFRSAASKTSHGFYPKKWIILQEWAFKKECTSLKLTYPLHSYHPKRSIVSQTPFFRCYVRFGGGKFKIGTD